MKARNLILLVLPTLLLTSCGFVLKEKPNQTFEAELLDMKQEYQNKLISAVDLTIYRDVEKSNCISYITEGRAKIEEASNCDQVIDIYNETLSNISNIKTNFDYVKTEYLCKFDSINIELYYDVDKQTLRKYVYEYKTLVNESVSISNMEWLFNLYTDYIHSVLTIEEIGKLEIKTLIDKYKKMLSDEYCSKKYRKEEARKLNSLLDEYVVKLEEKTTADSIISLYTEYLCKVSLLKTKKDYFDEEIVILSNESNSVLNLLSKYNFEEQFSLETQIQINKILNNFSCEDYLNDALNSLNYVKETILRECVKQSFKVDVNELISLAKTNRLFRYNPSLYRSDVKCIVQGLLDNLLVDLNKEDDALQKFNIIDNFDKSVSEYKTNDEMWANEEKEFIANLYSLYGSDVIEAPAVLNEANDFYQLAKIIDFYCFYQKDYNSFVSQKFRVKCLFTNLDAFEIRNKVYWKCELVHVAVGLNAYFDSDDQYVIFELTPYKIATFTNTNSFVSKPENKTNLVNSNLTKRDSSFDDFAYKSNSKKVLIWNSQQLWFALEHNYQPICVPNSPAEEVLNAAKNILRDVVSDDMTELEKIRAIYNWIGTNSYIDFKYLIKNNEDGDVFPFKNCAHIRAFYAEGILIDHLGVCSSFSKAYLILLKMEGITAVHTIGYQDPNVKTTFHEYVYIKYGNYWYFSDAERGPVGENFVLTSIFFLMASPLKEKTSTTQEIYPDLLFADSFLFEMYESINYCGISVSDLSVIDEFGKNDEKNSYISLIVKENEIQNAIDKIKLYKNLNYRIDSWYKCNGYVSLVVYNIN